MTQTIRLYPAQFAIEGAKIVPTVHVPRDGGGMVMYHISDEDVLEVADRLRAERGNAETVQGCPVEREVYQCPKCFATKVVPRDT